MTGAECWGWLCYWGKLQLGLLASPCFCHCTRPAAPRLSPFPLLDTHRENESREWGELAGVLVNPLFQLQDRLFLESRVL